MLRPELNDHLAQTAITRLIKSHEYFTSFKSLIDIYLDVATLYCAAPGWDFTMSVFLISNPVEARRARYAQFKGGAAELTLNGDFYFAHVISVMSVPGQPESWQVSIAPISRPATGKRPRPSIIYA